MPLPAKVRRAYEWCAERRASRLLVRGIFLMPVSDNESTVYDSMHVCVSVLGTHAWLASQGELFNSFSEPNFENTHAGRQEEPAL